MPALSAAGAPNVRKVQACSGAFGKVPDAARRRGPFHEALHKDAELIGVRNTSNHVAVSGKVPPQAVTSRYVGRFERFGIRYRFLDREAGPHAGAGASSCTGIRRKGYILRAIFRVSGLPKTRSGTGSDDGKLCGSMLARCVADMFRVPEQRPKPQKAEAVTW